MLRTNKLPNVVLDVRIYHEKTDDVPAFTEVLKIKQVNENTEMKKLNWVKGQQREERDFR